MKKLLVGLLALAVIIGAGMMLLVSNLDSIVKRAMRLVRRYDWRRLPSTFALAPPAAMGFRSPIRLATATRI